DFHVTGVQTCALPILPVLDTTPPVISNVQATGISTNGATITWTTNENASSRVNYGLTTSYGSNASNGTLKVNHSIALSGLSANRSEERRVGKGWGWRR